MVTPDSYRATGTPLGREVRQHFGRTVADLIQQLVGIIDAQLDTALRGDAGMSMADLSRAMEVAGAFHRTRVAWTGAAQTHWQQALNARPAAAEEASALAMTRLDDLGLVDDAVVEEKILSSRMAAAIIDAAGTEWRDLRLRMQRLERSDKLAKNDPLRPEIFAQCLIQAWTEVDLDRKMWALVLPAIQKAAAESFKETYGELNELLEKRGISAKLELRPQPRSAPGSGAGPGSQESGFPSSQPPYDTSSHLGGGATMSGAHHPGVPGTAAGWTPTEYVGPGETGMSRPEGAAFGQARGNAAHAPAPTGMSVRYGSADRYRAIGAGPAQAGPAPEAAPSSWWRGEVRPSALARAGAETRMVTGLSPMARVRQRAQGVWGQLKRVLSDQVEEGFGTDMTPVAPSPALAQALAEPDPAFAATQLVARTTQGTPLADPSGQVRHAAVQLRRHASELKAKAETPNEKAIIEIVALMFQSILSEERIPASIRVWFARLQLPVLRLALTEPDFFASTEHPARQLIDRMGACALGFDAAQIGTERLEREIKRVVQVIEQYPETGRRVFQLVLEEFKNFLNKSLTQENGAQQAATLAQLVEQKEALAVQYTIELRRMLAALPVSDDVRDFLFRVWSDVLAVATVRHGPHHEDTMRFKQAAAQLLWAVGAKRDRAARSQVVQQLPGLLQVLREGMATLTMTQEQQDGFIKQVNDAVMQAFVAREEGPSPEQLQEIARFLVALEDVVTEDPEGEMWLDPSMVEMIFGEHSAAIEVVADGGSLPAEAIVQWARQLELGSWFALDYQGTVQQVQYVWRSERGQLHLFSAMAEKSYLLQTQRVAAYLQAGLLVPAEDEALTVRATRDALAKLQAAPTQLLH